MVSVTARTGAPPVAGEMLDLEVGDVAHGGWCVARPSGGDGQAAGLVVFVRHALPGERVRAVVTQATTRFARAEAVQVGRPAPGRTEPPCRHAGPGGCGGCDWQHAGLPLQRELKARVVAGQLRRIAGIERVVTVEPLPGDEAEPAAGTKAGVPGLGWRTRVRLAVDASGRAGLRRHRSHEIVPVGDCLIAHPLAGVREVTGRRWPGASAVEVTVAPAAGERAVTVQDRRGRGEPSRRFLTQRAAGRDWRVAASGFWQVHPAAAGVLARAVLDGLAPQPGETALDLFCGAGLFAGVLAAAVGPAGTVIGVERDPAAVRDARRNLRPAPWARVHQGEAGEVLRRIGLAGAAVAVLDPPRAGAGRDVIAALAAGRLRRIAYVSCDPATLARDLAMLGARGWKLDQLRAFDAFPMTHHVECVALLSPEGR